MHPQTDCRRRWEALKERGNVTLDEITAIDNDTPWSEVEPRWWLDMMNEKQKLRALSQTSEKQGIV